ncbi:hypothetical protein OV320_1342 [Actinobacteria bacterium OV320]|nr:hypothetical protein OV320_1342 [Actinobacteria bacterium OV320]
MVEHGARLGIDVEVVNRMPQPMLTAPTADPALPPGWAAEPKWDGYPTAASCCVPAATPT